jgi:hypothetical protein
MSGPDFCRRKPLNSLIYYYDPEASRNLIRYFRYAFENGELLSTCARLHDVDRAFLDFVNHALTRFVDADDRGKPISLDAAFGIARARGDRNREDNELRNLAIAAAVELVARRDRDEHGLAKSEVVCKVISDKTTGLGWKSVEAIYADWCEQVTSMDTKSLTALAETLIKSP